MDTPARPLGLVAVQGRGALPFLLWEGEPLLTHASRRLAEAGVELYDFNVPWDLIAQSQRPVMIHDPLTPGIPPDFIAGLVAALDRAVLVGVRPVTDTLKVLEGDRVGGTVDRDSLWQVVGPVLLPTEVLADLDESPEAWSLAELVDRLTRAGHRVEFVEAPAGVRVVREEADLALLGPAY